MKLFSKKNCRKRPSTQHTRRRRILCFGHFCLWDWWSYESCWRWKSPRFGMEQHWLVSFLGFQCFVLLEFPFLFKKVCENWMCNYFQWFDKKKFLSQYKTKKSGCSTIDQFRSFFLYISNCLDGNNNSKY